LAGDGQGGEEWRFSPFTDGADTLDDKLRAQVGDTVQAIAAAVVPGFVALERHPEIEVRTRAVEFLPRRPEPQAQGPAVAPSSAPPRPRGGPAQWSSSRVARSPRHRAPSSTR